MKRNGATSVRLDVLPQTLSDEDALGILIADNAHAQNAVDERELLAHLLQEQADAGYDLAALGTDAEALREMLDSLTVPYFVPASEDEQGRLDEKSNVTCPQCGHEFEP